MKIWSSEIRELEKLHQSIKEAYPQIVKELSKLIGTDDENMALVYARRCLEIIITDLCECELKRPRGSEPLKRIIDKLGREEKIPHNIIASINTINSLSAFGAHPKEFDPQQVKPVLLSLNTTLHWYLKYSETRKNSETGSITETRKNSETGSITETRKNSETGSITETRKNSETGSITENGSITETRKNSETGSTTEIRKNSETGSITETGRDAKTRNDGIDHGNYGIAPQGRNEIAEKIVNPMKTSAGDRNRILQISAVVVLLVAICIIIYPRIFKQDEYKAFRNEAGQISLVVLPFENMTGDQGMDWFSKGISSLLTNGLASSDQLLVYNDHGLVEIIDGMKEVNMAGISGTQAREIAGKASSQAYITGSFQGRGDTYRILASLVGTESGDILLTRQVEGNLNSDNYLVLADSLCNQIRDQLEIRVLEQQADFDFRKAFTSSAEAYRNYIEGMNALVRADFDYAAELLEKALEIDSTFAFAAFSIAMAHNFKTNNITRMAKEWVERAHELKSSLPMFYQQWIDLWYNCAFEKDLPKLQRQLSALESAGIESRLFWHDMGVTQEDFAGNLEQALEDYEKVALISEERGDPWRFWPYYIRYGQVLRKMGRYQEEEKLYRQALEICNEERYRKEFYFGWAINAVIRGDTALASQMIEEYRKTKEILGELEGYEFFRCDIYFQGKDYKRAETKVRSFIRKFPDQIRGKYLLARILIEGELDPEEGLELIIAGLEQFPENLSLLDWKAYALHKLGRHREALDLLVMNNKQDWRIILYRYQWMQEVRAAL